VSSLRSTVLVHGQPEVGSSAAGLLVVAAGVVGSGGTGGARGQEIATKAIIAGCVGPEKEGSASRADDSNPIPRW
jgi:hypothetical protein